jgi:hypothetical protein
VKASVVTNITCIGRKIVTIGGFSASDGEKKTSLATNFSCNGSFSASDGSVHASSASSICYDGGFHASIAAKIACETAPLRSRTKSSAFPDRVAA